MYRVSCNAALVWINLRVAWQTLTLSLSANSCIWDCHKMNVNNASLKAKKSKAVPRRHCLFCRFSLKLIELRLLCSPQNHFTTMSRWGVLINIQAGCVWSWKTKGYGAFTISILQCFTSQKWKCSHIPLRPLSVKAPPKGLYENQISAKFSAVAPSRPSLKLWKVTEPSLCCLHILISIEVFCTPFSGV